MHLSAATPGEGTDALCPDPSSIAGRIDARPGELRQHVDAWLAHMTALKKRAGSIRAFRQVVNRAMQDCGWSVLADITHDNIVGYMDRKVAAGDWSSGTYNRNLSCFKSLTKYLRKRKLIAENPLLDADRAEDDSGPDCRASTIDEAKAMIRYAWVRGQADRRSKGDRALYWASLFGHGCRGGEPERWQWRHLFLDDAVPHIHWTADINKNRLEQDVALAPWLAELLRAHRDRMRELAKTTPVVKRRNPKTGGVTVRGVSPDDPNAFVFPHVPPRCTFRKDRDGAGIAATDKRGLSFSPRSARKYFKTTGLSLKIEGDMVRRLMRHAPHPDERYFDPPLEDQAAAAALMPDLWPRVSGGNPVDNSGPAARDLTFSRRSSDSAGATPMSPQTQNSINPRSQSAVRSSGWHSDEPLGLPGLTEFFHQGLAGPGLEAALAAVGSSTVSLSSSAEVPRGGLIIRWTQPAP